MRFSTSKVLALAFVVAIGSVGCGDDDGAGGTAGAGTGGSSGAGTGGSGGSGGTGGGGVTMCGGTTCAEFEPVMLPPGSEVIAGFLGDIEPVGCCIGTTTCGVTNPALLNEDACLERDVPGDIPSTECPTEMLTTPLVPIPFTGCCRPDNQCGLQVVLFGADLGVGCAEREAFGDALTGSMVSMFITSDLNFSGSTCTYAGSSMDGGTEDDAGN